MILAGVRWCALAVIVTVFGCQVPGALVDAARTSDDGDRIEPCYTDVRVDFDYERPDITWSLDGKSIAAHEIIPCLEERLKVLSAECMRVLVTHPKRWTPNPNPTLSEIEKWATGKSVAFKSAYATSHTRGVTFGRRPRWADGE